ncbi:MAG: RtcB family protein [Chloroflexaceae bacterium]|jgi:tRNA-splicing ligase RtcB|nr:RtcB family protein [Chloroflexaceae bacterium]
MKPNKIIEPWKGDKRFTAMAARAAQLKKAGQSVEQIVAAISAEFGPPPSFGRLHDTPRPYRVYGSVGDDIDPAALAQLELALRLPVAVQGALMPDAHHGYALPIGGVFAAHRAVAPAMVGVDIACRMHLTIFDAEPDEFHKQRPALFETLKDVTVFGTGGTRPRPADHAVLDDPRWQLTSQLRGLRDKAAAQLGTSGSGNHFAELVLGETLDDAGETASALPRQRFCGLLTHSGSRAVGYAIANSYSRLAAQETARVAKVPKFYEWLSLDSEAGQEYWQAMHLAGDYAQANHEVIHAAFARRSRLAPLAVIENHHNFAWQVGDLVIHRKGATPAEAGVLGVIPGSMASPSYIVEGQGVAEALNSASHGAGRRGSRHEARASIGLGEVRRALQQADILVEGLSADEAPAAYKDIERVMQLQLDAGLVRPLARMRPIAVVMAGEAGED